MRSNSTRNRNGDARPFPETPNWKLRHAVKESLIALRQAEARLLQEGRTLSALRLAMLRDEISQIGFGLPVSPDNFVQAIEPSAEVG